MRFSYIGYKTKTVKIENRTVINITLEEDNTVLDEVVVIGYGTMDKKELTSAVSHVSAKDFQSIYARPYIPQHSSCQGHG